MPFVIVRTVAELRAHVSEFHSAGERVGLVPTMGALHEGHLSLVRVARGRADRVIVTLFVNPKQFDNSDDLRLYPRTEQDDAAKLESEGVDLLYAPAADAIYPQGYATTISVSGVSEGLCGAHRPGHFDGVATVVAKLLLQSRADVAVFGEKDYQQLAVIRRMATDLDIMTEIVGAPIVRAADGLALSSRNERLSDEARSRAPILAQTLQQTASRLADGVSPPKACAAADQALRDAGFDRVEYCELRDAETLALVDQVDKPARLLAAAWLDGVRLIDNFAVMPSPDRRL